MSYDGGMNFRADARDTPVGKIPRNEREESFQRHFPKPTSFSRRCILVVMPLKNERVVVAVVLSGLNSGGVDGYL